MRIKIALDSVYVPEWNGNREAGEDQIKVYFRYLTGPERDGIYMTEPLKYDTEGKVSGMEIRIEDFYKKMIKTCITRIENLETEDEKGNVTKVENAEGLMKYPELADLYQEVRDFLVSENNPVDKKKLKSDTASWPGTGGNSSLEVGARLSIVSPTSAPSKSPYMSDQAT